VHDSFSRFPLFCFGHDLCKQTRENSRLPLPRPSPARLHPCPHQNPTFLVRYTIHALTDRACVCPTRGDVGLVPGFNPLQLWSFRARPSTRTTWVRTTFHAFAGCVCVCPTHGAWGLGLAWLGLAGLVTGFEQTDVFICWFSPCTTALFLADPTALELVG
jgi:hypothetical protein